MECPAQKFGESTTGVLGQLWGFDEISGVRHGKYAFDVATKTGENLECSDYKVRRPGHVICHVMSNYLHHSMFETSISQTIFSHV